MWNFISVQELKAVKKIKTSHLDLDIDQHLERLAVTDDYDLFFYSAYFLLLSLGGTWS